MIKKGQKFMKIKKLLSLTLAAITALCCMTACGSTNEDSKSDDSKTEDKPQEIRDISSWELVKEMKMGWNLGNTMDAIGNNTVAAETSWQPVKTSKEMVDFLKQGGFNVLRVPVSWGEHMDENYKVDDEWMARVKEIVDYGIENDMFVILNTHHEEWYFPTAENKDEDIKQLTALWTQIAEEFKNYDEHLIFEGLNEPRLRNTPSEWNGGDSDSREIVNEYANAFYQTVRNSGGNNPKRHLMITGYAASSMKTCLEAIKLPENDDKIIVSVHAYLPYSFALDTKGTDQFDESTDAGVIDGLFMDLEELFLSKNIPVIIGEYGSVNKNNIEERVECLKYYLTMAKQYGVPCCWWDNGATVGSGENFGLLDRNLPPAWKFPELVETMQEIYK